MADTELARARPREPLRRWKRWLRCVECGRVSEHGAHWRADLIGFAPPTVGTYCPDCAAREFDDA